MIGFDRLGKNGRFGNQMFQYASLKGIAKKNNYDFCIPSGPKTEMDFYDEENQHKLFIAFEMPDVNVTDNFSGVYFQESMCNFDKKLFENCQDNINLYGYFQTEKYFKHIEDEIKKDFTFKMDWLEPCRDCFGGSEYIGLHIRRTDYVQKQNFHPLCTLDYYERALKELPDVPVIIVSDDPDWCKNQSLFESDRFLVSDSKNNIIDMCILSLCKYHIIANSSFSWWGAWLAESQKVIAPKIWYGPASDNDDSDIIPNKWRRI